jgi:predicted DNA-binding transcriptional regulator YafY
MLSRKAAVAALAKIGALLLDGLGREAAGDDPFAGSDAPVTTPHLDVIRQAIRAEAKLKLGYTDSTGADTTRTVWPFALLTTEDDVMMAASCETRAHFGHFTLTVLR